MKSHPKGGDLVKGSSDRWLFSPSGRQPIKSEEGCLGLQQTGELANVGAQQSYATTERSLNPDHTGGAQMVISRKALKQAGFTFG